jgi:signal transduction histidine kinase
VHIEAVSADGSPFDPRAPMRLPAGKHRMTFRYLGLSLGNSDRVRYRYMLEGFDHGWSQAVTNRETTYGNLGAGTYRFRVIASNSDGLWDASEAAVGFEVEPTLWQRRWFQLACAICAGLMALLLYRLRVHQVARQFEARLSERTRIARDLHDTLLQSFQGLMLRFQAVHELIQDGKAKKQLEETLKRADQAIAEGRSAVYDLRSSTMPANDFAQAVRALGAELGAEDAVAFRLAVEGHPREFHPIVRDELYGITREALRNAFNHAHAHRIEVEITYAERLFRLRIRDDGEGIPPEVLKQGRPGHYGLNGMRERAEQMAAKFGIWSGAAGAGTEIELTISGSTAYGKSAKRFRFWPFREKVG